MPGCSWETEFLYMIKPQFAAALLNNFSLCKVSVAGAVNNGLKTIECRSSYLEGLLHDINYAL